MKNLCNWNDLEVLNAVLEEGSFSRAAIVLEMSQPTVSRHIERMETRIGKELFTRNPRGIEPTEAARHLGVYAAQMNDAMYAAQCTVDGTIESTAGIVKVSFPLGQGGIPLAKSLIGFNQKYPDISVDLIDGPLQNNLGRREADIDLRLERPTEPELIVKSVGHFDVGLWATEEYLQRHGMPKNVSDVNKTGFYFPADPVRQHYVTQLQGSGIDPTSFQIPIRCSNNQFFGMMLGCLGMTIMPMPVGYPVANATRILPHLTVSTPDFWLAMHSSLRRNARIRAVWDWLVIHLPETMDFSRQSEYLADVSKDTSHQKDRES